MLWLGVHFPLLPLEVFAVGAVSRPRSAHVGATSRSRFFEQADRDLEIAPTPTGEEIAPTVVVDQGGRVMLRDEAAVAAGIGLGSSLATAHSIAARLRHHRRSPEREMARLQLLAEALYGFSPRVSLSPPGGVALEIGGSLRLFGDAGELARRVEGLCRGMGHEVRVRWASTPLAALTLAGAGSVSLGRVPLDQAAVEPESLSTARIERLANMGIRTLEQLLALPRRGLARRFGADLVDYLARLVGDKPDPRRCIRPAERFQTTLHLLEPLDSKEALEFPMQRLLTDLQHWLVARQLGAEGLRWHFQASGAGHRTRLTVRFARAQQTREAFLDITRLRLAEAELPAEVISLTLEARRLEPWITASGGLFQHLPGTPSPAEAEAPADLVDQLRARLGRNACYSLQVADQHTPEWAWQRVAPLQRDRKSSVPRAGRMPPAASAAFRRPLWLFDPPRAIRREALTLLRGPERIHTGWWLDGTATAAVPGQARDYYVARHPSGAQCWVFEDCQERWYLHGYFS